MIPKIIHQTWKTHDVPVNCKAYVQTWKTLHPDWKYILWSDAELDEFVATHYPDFLEIFRNYPKGVQRADAARYLLLHHFGGVYTDLDTECLKPFDIFETENRIILCDEPKVHWGHFVASRTINRLLFNGTMVSPAGHPFWLELLKNIEKNCYTTSVLDSTGPIILSATVQNYEDQAAFSISSPHMFCGIEVNKKHTADQRIGDYGNLDLSVHHWMSSWYPVPLRNNGRARKILKRIKKIGRNLIYHTLKGKQYQAKIDDRFLNVKIAPATNQENIAVLIPIRDGATYLDRCIELLGDLDWPKEKLHITFCEGDSTDSTVAAIEKLIRENKYKFGSVKLVQKTVNTKFIHERRWLPKLQRQRRGGLAVVRNHLLDTAIKPDTDWALWIDVDVNNYPPTVLRQLLHEREKIIVPHCVRDNGSNETFDLNSFVTVYNWKDEFYFKHMIGGIYQPPLESDRRLHFKDTRYLHKLPLNGVGGTMILVHASVHRAGIRFPDLPYKDLIETEGFGQLARDHGIIPIGLPNLIITHPV